MVPDAHSYTTVDIYSLLAHLAGVKPDPNSGRPNTVRYLLRDPNALPDSGVAGTAPDCGEIKMLLSLGVAILATLVPTNTYYCFEFINYVNWQILSQ